MSTLTWLFFFLACFFASYITYRILKYKHRKEMRRLLLNHEKYDDLYARKYLTSAEYLHLR